MVQEYGFFNRIKRGWTIAKTGWHFIIDNPSCLLFPFISSLVNITIAIGAFAFYALYFVTRAIEFAEKHKDIPQAQMKKELSTHMMTSPLTKVILGFMFLFVCILVSSIMYTALSFYLANKIEGKPASIIESISRGFYRIKTLFIWSFINAILTIIFDMIRNSAKDGKFPFNLIAQLVAELLQFAWNVLTFFIYPIFALKNLDAIASIEESGKTMKKMWGQSIGATFNISLISLIGFITIVAPICFVSFLIFSKPLFIVICVATVTIVGMLVNLWIATAKTLFQTAAYLHTQGKQVGPFDSNFIQTSFTTKS